MNPPTRRPEVFVSATSADLRTCRQLIKEALLTLGCTPVEQTNFPPSANTVREMLRQKLLACDAVIHLAGLCYGAEPIERLPDESRRSYTQLEYEIARKLKKPVYVFVCGDDFPYDEHAAEDEERRSLQLAHRARLQSGDHLFTPVASRDELALRVHALQTKVEHLSADLKKSRSWLARGMAAGLIFAALLGGGIWWLDQRAIRTESRVSHLETELDKQRRYLRSAADEFVELQRQLRAQQLTDEEIFQRALLNVAAKENIPEKEIRAGIELFIAVTRRDASADDYDRALADFAASDFKNADTHAGRAADAAKARRIAAEKQAEEGARKAESAREMELQAHLLQGKSRYAQNRFGDAVISYQTAANLAHPASNREVGRANYALGTALSRQAEQALPAAASELRRRARIAFATARQANFPEINEAIIYNQAILELEQGFTEQGQPRMDAWRQAETLFHQLEQERSQFHFNQRDLVWNGRCLAEFLLLTELDPAQRGIALSRFEKSLLKRHEFMQKAGFLANRHASARGPLFEIHAALSLARAADIMDSSIRGANFLDAETYMQLAIPYAYQRSHQAVLKNDLALIQAMLATNGWGRGEELVDPETGDKVHTLDILPVSERQKLWISAIRFTDEAIELLSAEQNPQPWSTIVANRGIFRAQQASTLPAGEERLQFLRLARSDLETSIRISKTLGAEPDPALDTWLKFTQAADPTAPLPAVLPANQYLWHARYLLTEF